MNQTPPHSPPELATTIRLAAVPSAVGCARSFVRQTLRRWQLPESVETVELIVSELVTNAILATGVLDSNPDDATLAAVATIILRLSVVGSSLRIEAWDESTAMPVVRPHHQQAESGRGMVLVGALSERWGAIAAPDGSGKVVWADVPLEADTLTAPPAPTALPKRQRKVATGQAVYQAAIVDIALLERVLLGLKRLSGSESADGQPVDGSLFLD